LIIDGEDGFYVYSQYFANDITVRTSQFVSEKYLVLVTNNHSITIVYDVTTSSPSVKTHINTTVPVLFILPTGNAAEVALVDGKGKITIHRLD
jgi:hypothetical protein